MPELSSTHFVASDYLVTRLPIHDTNTQLYGYELIVRDVLGDALKSLGFHEDMGYEMTYFLEALNASAKDLGHPYFLLVSEAFVCSEMVSVLTPDAIILEFDGAIQPTDALLTAVAGLKRRGFRFSIKNYDLGPHVDALMPYLDFIKMDVVQGDVNKSIQQALALKKKDCQLIAGKVENKTILQSCAKAGFNLFQGYYLATPTGQLGSRIKPGYQGVILVLKKLQQPSLSMDELAKTVSAEPRLVYYLLKLINSPACGLSRQISSVKDAIVFLGLTQVRKWALMVLLSATCGQQSELVRLLLTRARACERFAEMCQMPEPEKYFLAGMLSGLDLLLEVDKASALREIQLDAGVLSAILDHQGDIGEALTSMEDVEDCAWEMLGKLPVEKRRKVFISHLEGSVWAEETLKVLECEPE